MADDTAEVAATRVDVGTERLLNDLRSVRDWLLLDCSRYALAGGFVAVGFVLFAWLEFAGVIDPERSATPLFYLFSALAGGNITLVTIVISINQLVLSRELRSPRELRAELDAAAEYRDEVEAETNEAVIPEQPRDFLSILARNTYHHVRKFDAARAAADDERLQAELADLEATLTAQLEEIVDHLEESEYGVFPALSTVLDANFATRINHSRWIRQTYADALADATADHLRGVEERLEQLDVARQYFKTIYLQQQLASLSKLVLYVGLAAELVAITFLVVIGHAATAPLVDQLLLIPLAVAVNLAPLGVLFAYFLRVATVANRTAAITPFISPN